MNLCHLCLSILLELVLQRNALLLVGLCLLFAPTESSAERGWVHLKNEHSENHD